MSLYSILDARLDGEKDISEETHIHNALRFFGELEWCQFISYFLNVLFFLFNLYYFKKN